MGDIESGWSLPLSRGVQFPLWLDLGYRMGPVVLGAYGQFAPGLYASGPGGCSYGSCFTYGWRAGVEVQIHPFGRDRTVDPWFSFGFGYEWNTSKVTDGTGNYQDTLQGWDFARYGLGVDFALTPSLRIGPFLHGTLSQFTNDASSPPGYLRWIQERAIHGWITVGVRLTTLL